MIVDGIGVSVGVGGRFGYMDIAQGPMTRNIQRELSKCLGNTPKM